MNQDAEKRIAAKPAKTMAMLFVRYTHLETIHAGKSPVTKTGDWNDVIEADGDSIPWTVVSHPSDNQMRGMLRPTTNRPQTRQSGVAINCAKPDRGKRPLH